MEAFKQFVEKNKGWLFGAVAGVVVAVLMLIIGFFPTLLIVVCAAIGGIISGISVVKKTLASWIQGMIYKIFGERY